MTGRAGQGPVNGEDEVASAGNPAEGDCVTKPLTKVHIVFNVTLKS